MSGTNYTKTQKELADFLGMSVRNFQKTYGSAEGNPGKTQSGYNKRQWAEFVNELQRASLGSGDLRDEKLKREIERLDIQLAQMRGELLPVQEHCDGIAETCRAILAGLDELEAWCSADFPDDPSVVQKAQKISDRVKTYILKRLEEHED